jgi:5'-phosphate synthase pdxT subunit
MLSSFVPLLLIETELAVPVLGSEPFHAVFIRAPVIESVGPQVEVLAMLSDGTPVAARQGDLLTTAFHPELGNDLRIHRYFLGIVVLGIVEARAAAS